MRFRILLAATLFAASPVAAKERTFDFVARVDGLASPASTEPVLGTLIKGSFAFDDALKPVARTRSETGADDPYRGADYADPSIKLRLQFDRTNFLGTATASVRDYTTPPVMLGDGDADNFRLFAETSSWTYDLAIWQPDRAWLKGTALPVRFPRSLWQGTNPGDELSVPSGALFAWNGRTGQGFNATILSVTGTASDVPEPASWALLITGFGLAGAALRRGVGMERRAAA